MRNKSWLPMALAMLLLIGIGAAWAKSSKTATTAAAPQTVTQQGMVKAVKVKSNLLTISWKTEKKTNHLTVQINPDTQMLYQDSAMKLAEIKKGDQVEITAQKVNKNWVASKVMVLQKAVEPTAKTNATPNSSPSTSK